MEISFRTTAAGGLLSRVALISRTGTWAISGPGIAPGWPWLPCLLERPPSKAKVRKVFRARAISTQDTQSSRSKALPGEETPRLTSAFHVSAAFSWPPPEQFNSPFLI